MSTEPIYLVTDAGSLVTAFTGRRELQAYLKRRRDSFTNPLIYTFSGSQGTPSMMTMSAALAEWSRQRRWARRAPGVV